MNLNSQRIENDFNRFEFFNEDAESAFYGEDEMADSSSFNWLCNLMGWNPDEDLECIRHHCRKHDFDS
ncbi:hypothetical protein ACQZV8_18805 [Magnetococcales bacterium HHB-1]